MNLLKKKRLAARTLEVGLDRIALDGNRLDEFKEAITKQDIKDLFNSGVINIKPIKGRKKIMPRGRRKTGKVRKKINTRKKDYVIMTKKLRAYLKEMNKQGKITKDKHTELRKKIRNKVFKSKRHLKENLN